MIRFGIVTAACLSSIAFASDRESCIKEHSKLFGFLFDERTIIRCVQEHNEVRRIHLDQAYWQSPESSNTGLSDDQFRNRISEFQTSWGSAPSSANILGGISSASDLPFSQRSASKRSIGDELPGFSTISGSESD